MRRLLFGLAGVVLLALAMSCSEADEIRTGIDDLNARLDAISAQVDRINGDLAYSRGVITGSIAILGYSKDAYGNYTVEFSDGGEMTIYSGEVCGDIPVFSVGDDGWTYTADGETYPLLGPDGQPAPVSGSTPKVRVNGDGRWEYSFDGSIWMSGFGSALPSAGSIFDDVYPSEENDGLVFKWHSGDSDYEKEVKLYGGLDLTVDFGNESAGPLVFRTGETRSFPITQTNVSHIAIETAMWGVEITEDTISITAPAESGTADIVIKIFSEEGYCRPVIIPVKAE